MAVEKIILDELKKFQLNSDGLFFAQIIKIGPVDVVVMVDREIRLVKLELCCGFEDVELFGFLLVFESNFTLYFLK